MKRLIERFRLWLRAWLQVDAGVDAVLKLQGELEQRFTGGDGKLDEWIENFQRQLSELAREPEKLTKKPEEPVIQVMGGHTRFTDRKRRYEFEHRKPLTTPAGEQIEANSKLIAAGVRKETPSEP